MYALNLKQGFWKILISTKVTAHFAPPKVNLDQNIEFFIIFVINVESFWNYFNVLTRHIHWISKNMNPSALIILEIFSTLFLTNFWPKIWPIIKKKFFFFHFLSFLCNYDGLYKTWKRLVEKWIFLGFHSSATLRMLWHI